LSSWPLDGISLKQVTLKTVGLIALCTGQRTQTLSMIRLSNIRWDDTVQIAISDQLKTTSISRSNPVLRIPPFESPALCPRLTLLKYREMTENIRAGEDFLFLSYQGPHKKVTSQTIGRWLVYLLKEAGINTDTFHAHSFRHASSSKAVRGGINIDTILKRVGWSSKSHVFAKYYNRPIDCSSEYSNVVLAIK
jgi:integrase